MGLSLYMCACTCLYAPRCTKSHAFFILLLSSFLGIAQCPRKVFIYEEAGQSLWAVPV